MKKFVMILVIGIVSTANGDVNVPGDFFTIQAAIDSPAVYDGDTVTVLGGSVITPVVYSGPGNYNIDFRGKNIILRTGDSLGNYAAGTCIIDCQNQGRGFIFHSGENASMGARLQGFIIVDGNAADPLWPQDPDVDASGYGGGIYIKNSSPAIQSCVITDCNADAGGGAIFCDDNSYPFIVFCDIGQSYTSYNSAGVGFYKYIDIEDANDVNLLDVNDLYQLGGGIYCRNSSPWIIKCNILWNVSAGSGGGIACENSNPTIQNCSIRDNYCYVNDDRIDQHGGGIYTKDCTGQGPRIEGCSIMGNAARWSGGGVAVMDSNTLIEDCQIYDNDCWARAGGIYSDGNPSDDPNVDPNKPNCIIKSCVITHNRGYWSGGVSSNYGSVADIDNCTIAYNAAAWHYLPGGLECYYGDANVTNTNIWGNTGVQVSKVGSVALQACGDREHPYPDGDLNRDCHVDFRDFATMARHWLECTAPECD